MLKDDDEGKSGGKYVPILGTQTVRIGILGSVPVTAVLTDRRPLFTLVSHVRSEVRRVELGQRAVDVTRQRLSGRVCYRVYYSGNEVRGVRYNECLRKSTSNETAIYY